MNNKISDKRALRVLFWNIFARSWRLVFTIFLNIFIWKKTWDIKIVSLWNIVYLTTHTFSFIFFSKIVKIWYRRIMNFIGLVWLSIVYLLIAILWKEIINYIYFVAFFIWFFNWIYWINFHSNQFDLTTFKNRWNFEWIKKSLNILSKILIPSLIWTIITLNYKWLWYEISFIIWTIFFILWIIIWNVKIETKNYQKYDLLWVFKKVFRDKDIFRSIYTYSFTWFSFWNSLLDVIIPIILFIYVKEEVNLWFLMSFLSIVSIFASYIFGRFVTYSKYRITILLSWIIYVLSIFWFLSFSEIKYLILFSAILEFFALFFSIPQKVISDNIFHKIKNYKNYQVEYIVIREIFLYFWWILSFITLYFLGSIKINHLIYLLIIIMFTVWISTYLLSTIKIEDKK